MSFANDRDDLVWEYRQYDRLMTHWREALPPDRFLEVEYEELSCLRSESNKRVVTTASVWQVRQPVYRGSVEQWRNYEPWLGALRELLPRT